MNGLRQIKASDIAIMKSLFWLALPMAGSQLINFGSTFLCVAMLASLGHNVLAASALIFVTQATVMVSFSAILFSLSVLIGHAYGAKKFYSIGTFWQQGCVLSLLLSIPVIFIFWHISKIFIFLVEPGPIIHISRIYFHAYVLAVIPMMLSVVNMQFGYAVDKPRLMLTASVLSVGVLLLVSYILIFGKWGFPKFGVDGLAVGATVQYLFFFLYTTIYFYYNRHFSTYQLFSLRKQLHFDQFLQIFYIGWPICIQTSGEMISSFVSVVLISWLGVHALAACQIVDQYYFLIVVPMYMVAQAAGILVGQAYGSHHELRIRKISYVAIGFTLFVGILVAMIYLFFPKVLAMVYINISSPGNAETLRLTIALFAVLAFLQIFDMVRETYIGLLRGLFDTRFSMYMSLLTVWIIGIPLSYLLAFTLHFGVVGFVFGTLISLVIDSMIMGSRWWYMSRKLLLESTIA